MGKAMNVPELMDHSGAHDLADRIRRYWRKHGYDVRTAVEIVHTGKMGDGSLYCVRSDMLNGFPRRALLKAAAQ